VSPIGSYDVQGWRGEGWLSAAAVAVCVLVLVGLVACTGGPEGTDGGGGQEESGPSARADPDSLSVYLEAGRTHFRLGQHDEAIAAFRRTLIVAPRKPGVRYALAMSLRARHRHAEAVAELGQAVALAPEKAEYHFRYGEALLAIDDVPGALVALDLAVRRDSTHANARLDRGRLLAQLNRLSEAEVDFERVRTLQPGNVWAHLGLGGIYTQQGRHPEAIAALEDAVRLEPRNAHAHYLLSQAFWRSGQQRKREDALQEFRRLSRAWEHLKQGAILAERGAIDQAIAAWERAVEADSTCMDAYLRLGEAHMGAGRPEPARRAFRRVLELEPEHANVREQLVRMEEEL